MKQLESQQTLDTLKREAEKNNCKWIHNPLTASHFGGLWERAIRKVRSMIDAVMLINGSRAITRDELETLFKEISAIINNTPLSNSPSDNPNEPSPLTPASLLTLKDAKNPPPLEFFTKADLDCYGKLRWRRIQYLAQEFWSRWHCDCLSELISRQKWTKDVPNMCLNDDVVVRAKNLPRNDWRTGTVHS